MNNEKGVTLIEVVAVLAVISVVFVFIGLIAGNSMKISNRVTTERNLQHEANYITERIRNEYLQLKDEPFLLMINNEEKRISINNDVISEGFLYYFCNEEGDCEETEREIDRRKTEYFKLRIIENERSYTIETTFNKLR